MLVVVSAMLSPIMAQDIIFQEDFQSQTLGQFISVDVDMLPLGPEFAGLEGGFNNIPVSGPSDFRAVGVSTFQGGGTADNWLISSAVDIPAQGAVLRWTGISLSGDNRMLERYRILVSTTSQDIATFTDIAAEIIDEMPFAMERELDLAAYAGTRIYFAFNQNGTDKFALSLDDITITSTPTGISAELVDICTERYQNVDNPVVSLKVANSGSETITDLIVDVSTSATMRQFALDSLDIMPGDTSLITLDSIFASIPQRDFITALITNVNGQSVSSNELTEDVYLVADPPFKPLFVEEVTSTGCAFCPEGIVSKQLLQFQFQDLIVVSIHDDDPMENTVASLGATNTEGFKGFPSAIVNRLSAVFHPDATEALNGVFARVSPFRLELDNNYNPTTREIQVTLSGEAHTTMNPETHRFGVMIVEDNVTGTTPDFAQANNYSREALNIPLVGLDGRDWQQLSDPVPAADMIYDDVVRDILGGYDGILESFPTIANGEMARFQVGYLLPSVFNEENIRIIAYVTDAETGEIVSATEGVLDFSSAVESLDFDIRLSLFPNPASDVLNIQLENDTYTGNFSVEIYSMTGSKMAVYQHSSLGSNTSLSIPTDNLGSGAYSLIIRGFDSIVARRFVIK